LKKKTPKLIVLQAHMLMASFYSPSNVRLFHFGMCTVILIAVAVFVPGVFVVFEMNTTS
jgi:hypothetical protein